MYIAIIFAFSTLAVIQDYYVEIDNNSLGMNPELSFIIERSKFSFAIRISKGFGWEKDLVTNINRPTSS